MAIVTGGTTMAVSIDKLTRGTTMAVSVDKRTDPITCSGPCCWGTCSSTIDFDISAASTAIVACLATATTIDFDFDNISAASTAIVAWLATTTTNDQQLLCSHSRSAHPSNVGIDTAISTSGLWAVAARGKSPRPVQWRV